MLQRAVAINSRTDNFYSPAPRSILPGTVPHSRDAPPEDLHEPRNESDQPSAAGGEFSMCPVATREAVASPPAGNTSDDWEEVERRLQLVAEGQHAAGSFLGVSKDWAVAQIRDLLGHLREKERRQDRRLANQERLLDETVRDNESLRSRIKEREGEADHFRENERRLAIERQTLEGQLQEIAQAHERQKQVVASLNRQLKDNDEEAEHLNSQLLRNNLLVDTKEEELRRSCAEVDTYRLRWQEATVQIKELQGGLESLRREQKLVEQRHADAVAQAALMRASTLEENRTAKDRVTRIEQDTTENKAAAEKATALARHWEDEVEFMMSCVSQLAFALYSPAANPAARVE